MTIDIAEIKKLPVEQKLKIIDELWESIDDNKLDTLSQKEEMNLLEERMELYEKGKMKFSPWNEVKERLNKKFSGK
ncbi:MAG TPA: addiction module protein [Puia sp.]|jgi:putative addiction module component (TIGR02574 family)|nr:addiction module protein [Puia sp.]